MSTPELSSSPMKPEEQAMRRDAFLLRLRRNHRFFLLYFGIAATVLTLSFIGCAFNCDPAFPSSSIIDKYRVLAIKAEPAEPTPGQTVSFSFLSTDPKGFIVPKSYKTFPSCMPDSEGKFPDASAFWLVTLPKPGSGGGGGFGQIGGGGGADAGSPDGATPERGGGFTIPESFSSLPEGFSGLPEGGFPGGIPAGIAFPPCGTDIQWKIPNNAFDGVDKKTQFQGVNAIGTLRVNFGKQEQTTLKNVRVYIKPPDERYYSRW